MKRAFRRPLAGLAIVGAAALIAGCGGGGSDRLSLEDFRSQADAVCTDGNRATDAIQDPTSTDTVLPFLEATRDATAPQIERLKDITPPEDLKARWNEAISLQESQAELLNTAIERIKGGEDAMAVLNSIGGQASSNQERLRTLARELGLTVCGAGDDDDTTTTATTGTDTTATTLTPPVTETTVTDGTDTTVTEGTDTTVTDGTDTTGTNQITQYVADVQEAAGALTKFGELLQSVSGVDDLKTKAPQAQEALDEFDAAIAKLGGYTLPNDRLERQRAGLVAEGPKVSDVLRRFTDAAAAGDLSAIQSLLPEVMSALNAFRSAATDA